MKTLRIPLLMLAVAALIAGIWSGFWRAGWNTPTPHPPMFDMHGALMIGGFLGALISLERAVAAKALWTYGAPLLAGISTVLLLLGQILPGQILLVSSSTILVLMSIFFVEEHPSLHMVTMGLGAVLWLAGNTLWLAGYAINQVVLWWAAFLILTIAGERLELSRILALKNEVKALFIMTILILLSGMVISTIYYSYGMRIAGLGMFLLAVWLLSYDLARKSVRRPGLTRFVAVSLITGYIWLLVAGLIAIIWGSVNMGLHYDAILHAIFVGFTFSMIFGHAPIIFPGILGIKITFHPIFYLHLVVLHLSLMIRMYGDLMIHPEIRIWGSLLNGLAIVLFFGNTLMSILFLKEKSASTIKK
ncbi:MAG: hypothetical protein D6675_16670 [Gemmatimonadetes bacterium]|nr:MAG: hypothetical protein D6675_16670 [Gemmatimonadota bacterium]